MHVESIQLFRVPLSVSADVRQPGDVESVFVGLTSGGQTGWGEVSAGAGPIDDSQWAAGVFACLRDWLAPAVAGRTVTSGEKLREALAPFRGNRRAKAALDLAWHNLAALRQQTPLYQCLGGRRTSIPLSASSLGVMQSIDELLAKIAVAFETGYELVTLARAAGWDVQMLRAVRQAFPSGPIAVDCDGLCTLAQREMFFRIEDFHLQHIEQPLAGGDLVGHAMLQESLRTPICLHQSVTSIERVEQAIDLGSCRAMKIEPGRVGGFAVALAIREACEAANIPCSHGAVPQARWPLPPGWPWPRCRTSLWPPTILI